MLPNDYDGCPIPQYITAITVSLIYSSTYHCRHQFHTINPLDWLLTPINIYLFIEIKHPKQLIKSRTCIITA